MLAYRTPRKLFETIPVTSRQLKFCSVTVPKCRFKAFRTLFAPIAPKNVTFASVAMKKKFQPAA